MSNINLRLYGEQIYPTLSKYLSSYISPEIQKEDFLEKYKNGSVEINDISLKEKLSLQPQINIEQASIGELKLHIPNETENFSIFLNNMKCSLILSDIKEDEIKSKLIEEKKKLINDFITYSIGKIEKKDGTSFLDGIIQNFVDKIINGIEIEIKNLELRIKTDNKNGSFLFLIEEINYSDEKGIKIKNIAVIYEKELIKINVIYKFDFIVDIIHSNEEQKQNKLNLVISDFKFEINKNIYFEFLNLFNIFDYADYKKIYLKYKNLILYHKPSYIEGKKDYKSLWYYAIKTVIKLQKYIKYKKPEIFDLLYSSQIKIIKKYLESDEINEKFLLPNEINSLKATKEKVEKKVIENKKGNVLANAFSFFFGAKKKKKKEELTEEEKELSDEIYTEENLINYLNGNLNTKKNASLTSIIDKIKKFLSNVTIDINIVKLELIINNINIGNKQNLFIKGMRMNINFFDKEVDVNYYICDIGYEQDKSFFEKEELTCINAIEFSRDKNNFIKLDFNFKNIELNEDLFICLITFFKSIQTKKKQKLFKPKKYIKLVERKEKKEKENEIINNIKNFSFMNNFKLSNIPSFSIQSKDNKIKIKVINYSMTENSISFTINIKDSYSTILSDFTFNPKYENDNFIFHLDSPMNIILSSKSTKIFFLNYLRYKKELSNNINNEVNINNKNEELFAFNFTSVQKIDLSNIDMNNYSLDIFINKINIQIFEEEKNYQSSFILENFKILYQKKNLDIDLKRINIKSNLMSTMILYFLDFESPLFANYQKEIQNKINDINDIFINSGENIENKNVIENNLDIKNEFDYGKLLKEVLNEFNFRLTTFYFIFQANNLTMALVFNMIKAFKNLEKNEICVSFDDWYFEIQSEKSKYNSKKIISNKEKTLMKYEINTNIIKAKMKSVYFDTNLEEVVEIWDNLAFLLNQINWDIILCKMDFKVDDFVLVFDHFKYSIDKILFINFKEGNNKNDTFYIKLLEFNMINKNNDKIKIIYEKELDINYVFKTSTENEVIIKCNNVNIQISQHDILFLLLCIKLPEKKQENNYIKKDSVLLMNSNKNLKNINLLDFEELSVSEKEKSGNKLHTKLSISDIRKEYKRKFCFSVNINIPKLNLSFCLNDYSKQSEFIIESSKIKIKSIINENILDKQIYSDLSYSFLLGKLNFKDFSNKDIEYTILTKRNNKFNFNLENNEKENKNVNEIKKKEEEKEKEQNQVEIISDNNGYTVNINENEINVRIDSLLSIFYYFKGAIPIDEVIDNLEQVEFNSNNNKKNKNLQFQINFNNSQFQLTTSFDGKENLYLDIDKFVIIYNCSSDGKLPYGNYMINLNKISTNIASKKSIRELFFTNNNFLLFKINFTEELFSSNIIMDILTINLSYRDLLSFLRTYKINLKKFKNALRKSEEYLKNLEELKTIQQKQNNNDIKKNKIKTIKKNNYITKTGTPIDDGKIVFSGELNFEKLDISLIDNSKGSYHPFMNFIFDKMLIVLNPDNTLESSFNFVLFSYNYIACIWEPTIDKTTIKFSNILKKEVLGTNNKLKIDLNSISINLSDMAISFTLLTFNNWLNKLEQKRKKIEEELEKNSENNIILKTDEPKNISKVTNNQVINYTGIELDIIHNDKKINCPPLKKVILDYNKSNKTLNHIFLLYNKEQTFEIPLEKIVTLRHIINNELSIISDNNISENRSINIHLYSPVIFKNKSIYSLQIKIENKEYGTTFLVLNPNSVTGLPLHLVNKKTTFNFMLIKETSDKNNENNERNKSDYSQDYNLNEILNINTNTVYQRAIKFKKKYLIMKLDHKIRNVRTLVINTEYSIVNCLPCDLIVHFSQTKYIIKRCTQYFIDHNYQAELHIRFSINTSSSEFSSKGINILNLKNNEEDNYIEFQTNKSKDKIKLKYYFKKNEEENTLIIYSEYILYNKSGIVLSVNSKNNKRKFCFLVDKNIYLISLKSSNNDYKEANIQLLNDHFISSKINFSKLIEASPYLNVRIKNDENGDFIFLNIKKHFSYMSIINNPNFKENISTAIFTILPSCRISNILSTQRFFICDYKFQKNHNIIGPLQKENFHFYGRGEKAVLGISVLNLNSSKVEHLIKFQFKSGIYTLSAGLYTFNIEVRKNPSDGCIDVFVTENTIENSQILLENLTDESINIYQNGLEKYMQILQPKEIQTLKLFSLESIDYVIETSNSFSPIKFDTMEEKEKKMHLNNKIMALIQSNGMKMKVTFYLTEEINKLKSFSINNYYSINIKSISISIIGDNEFQDTKLNNYQRNELLLFIFNQIAITFNVEKKTGISDKDSVQTNIFLTEFAIYNQVSKIGKFSKILFNKTPFLSIYGEFDYFQNFKIIKMKKENIVIGQLELGIDPKFIIVLIDFFDNILYRMNITNFNVHEIFINQDKNIDVYSKLNEEYSQSRILLNARNYEFPEINTKFEISNIGLKELLKERIDCSDFYIWLAKGLVGRRHTLKLDASQRSYYNGGLGFFFKYMFYIFKSKFENQITEMGLKGFVGQFKNLFSYDDTSITNVQKERIRFPRAFYGKFKYFKEFDRTDAYLIFNVFAKNEYLRNKYYPTRIISGYKVFYLFTNLTMFSVSHSNFGLMWNIDYFSIKKAEENKNIVIVIYNQVIDNKTSCKITCDNESIAKLVSQGLNEESISNKEDILAV